MIQPGPFQSFSALNLWADGNNWYEGTTLTGTFQSSVSRGVPSTGTCGDEEAPFANSTVISIGFREETLVGGLPISFGPDLTSHTQLLKRLRRFDYWGAGYDLDAATLVCQGVNGSGEDFWIYRGGSGLGLDPANGWFTITDRPAETFRWAIELVHHDNPNDPERWQLVSSFGNFWSLEAEVFFQFREETTTRAPFKTTGFSACLERESTAEPMQLIRMLAAFLQPGFPAAKLDPTLFLGSTFTHALGTEAATLPSTFVCSSGTSGTKTVLMKGPFDWPNSSDRDTVIANRTFNSISGNRGDQYEIAWELVDSTLADTPFASLDTNAPFTNTYATVATLDAGEPWE